MNNQVLANYLYVVSAYKATPTLGWVFRDSFKISSGVSIKFYSSNFFTKNLSEMFSNDEIIENGGGVVSKDTPGILQLSYTNYFAIKVNYTGSATNIASFENIPTNPNLDHVIKIADDINITEQESKLFKHAMINQKQRVLGAGVFLVWDGHKWDDLVPFYQSSNPSHLRVTMSTLSIEVD